MKVCGLGTCSGTVSLPPYSDVRTAPERWKLDNKWSKPDTPSQFTCVEAGLDTLTSGRHTLPYAAPPSERRNASGVVSTTRLKNFTKFVGSENPRS